MEMRGGPAGPRRDLGIIVRPSSPASASHSGSTSSLGAGQGWCASRVPGALCSQDAFIGATRTHGPFQQEPLAGAWITSLNLRPVPKKTGHGHCLVTLCFAGWGSDTLEPVFLPTPPQWA